MSSERKKTVLFFGAIIIFVIVNYIFCSRFKINDSNLYLYINNYNNGFCSAGLIGTIIQFLGNTLEAEVFSYEGIYRFCKIGLLCYFIVMLIFLVSTYYKGKHNRKEISILFVLILSFTANMFCTSSTLGSADMYMSTVLFLSLLVLVNNISPIVVIILTIIGALIHPAYVIKCLPVIIVYLVYKILKKKKRYLLYIIVLLSVSLAIVFIGDTLTITNGYQSDTYYLYGNIMSVKPWTYSEKTAELGAISTTLIMPEYSFIGTTYLNLIIYVVLMLPYVLVLHSFQKKVCESSKEEKKLYGIIRFGSILFFVGFIIKSDYGNMIYYVVLYYLLITVVMMVEKDEYYENSFDNTLDLLKQRMSVTEVLLIYPLLFVPITNKEISTICTNIANMIV